jgi:hypothetical protein
MSAREGCVWREIPAKPGEKARHGYFVNGKVHAWAGMVTSSAWWCLHGDKDMRMVPDLATAMAEAETEVWK